MDHKLQSDIVLFLTSVPNIDDGDGQRALLFNAGLDEQLKDQISVNKPPAKFIPGLVSTLSKYGALDDGRNALEATLEAAKKLVGQEKQAICDTLIQKLQSASDVRALQSNAKDNSNLPVSYSNPKCPVRLKIEGKLAEFNKTKHDDLIKVLAALLDIDKESIQILSAGPGCIQIIIELPTDSAMELMLLFNAYKDELVQLPQLKELSILTPELQFDSDSLGNQFDRDLFVGRKKESSLFFDTIRARARQGYLEFHGIAGQGKSELIKWIYHNVKQEGYFSAYVDFESPRYYQKDIYPILETIAEQLSAQSSNDFFPSFKEKLLPYLEEFREYYYELSTNPQTADQRLLAELEDALIKAFNNDMESILKSQKIVLFFDSIEKAYKFTLRNFEEQVLKHHVKHRNFMFCTASQQNVKWKNSEIRNMVKYHELKPLESSAVREQVERIAKKKNIRVEDSTIVAEKMLQLTLGHPFSNYKLIDFWTEGFKSPLKTNVIEERFNQSINELVEKFIEDKVLEHFQLNQNYPPAKEILWYLAPLRHIDFNTFCYILTTFLGDWFRGKTFVFFENLMNKFRNAYIFIPGQFGIGYDLAPVVRNILLWDMRRNAPQDFIEVQKKLAEYYDKWIQQSHDTTQISNIVERLYHYATYLEMIQTDDINTLIKTELKRYLDSYFTLKFVANQMALFSQLNRLFIVLERDKELIQFVNVSELLEIIKERMKFSQNQLCE